MTPAEKEKALACVHVIQDACMRLMVLLPPNQPEGAPADRKMRDVLAAASALEFRIIGISTEKDS